MIPSQLSGNVKLDKDQTTVPSFKIKREYLKAPSLSYVARKRQTTTRNCSVFNDNKIESQFRYNEDVANLWREIHSAYRVHRWNNKELAYFQNITLLNSMKTTGLTIAKFSHLKHLDVSFRNCYCEKEENLDLFISQIARNLHNISELSLKFNYFEKRIITSLKDLGRCLPNLKKLKLSFIESYKTSLTDQDIITFGKKLLPYLKNINTLNFEFYRCQEISDTALNSLVTQILRSLDKLTNLTLTMNNCRKITGKELGSIKSSSLKKASNLKYLNLDFSENYNITDESLAKLVTLMSYLPGLRHVTTFLSQCHSITSKGLDALSTGIISNLAGLKQFSYNFDQSQQISLQSIQTLFKTLNLSLNAKIKPVYRETQALPCAFLSFVDQEGSSDEGYE